jgi:hypothetical protein
VEFQGGTFHAEKGVLVRPNSVIKTAVVVTIITGTVRLPLGGKTLILPKWKTKRGSLPRSHTWVVCGLGRIGKGDKNGSASHGLRMK